MDEHALRELDRAILRLADGDRTAFTTVFSTLWPELVRFAERFLGPGPDADDAAQQALEKLFAQIDQFDPSRSALAWALAVTTWECRTIAQRRKRRREDSLELVRSMSTLTPSPEENAIRERMLGALRQSIEGLSSQDRQTIEEAFFSDVEGPTATAFRKRKERALKRLRNAWEKIHGR